MELLKEIEIILPISDKTFSYKLLNFLSQFGILKDQKILFNKSNSKYYPLLSLRTSQVKNAKVKFLLTENEVEIDLINSTGKEKKSPHKYSYITIKDFLERMKEKSLSELDHIGFDLPWLTVGIHPEIANLRKVLKQKALYYLFPTGEPWDFILPGTKEEISSLDEPDLTLKRRPKFEIVSLDKTSMPLIQIDFMVKEQYETLVALFPEAIHDPDIKNMWVYIKNPCSVDICFVLNEYRVADWSNFFKGHRFVK